MKQNAPRAGLLAAVLFAAAAVAGEYSGTKQSTRLYTAPDPAARGGLRGTVASGGEPVLMVLVVHAVDPSKVYRGKVDGDGCTFAFAGLPPGKYDLLVLLRTRFCEGLTLQRGDDTLADGDRKAIESTIMRSIPFYDTKRIERCEGTPGADGKARCVLQEVRVKPTTTQAATILQGIQPRSIKLAMLEDVGPGWHLVDTREIVRMEAGPGDPKGLLPHAYSEALHGIRVVDEVKDLGAIDLRSAP